MEKADQQGPILSCEAGEATTTPVQVRDEEGLQQGSGVWMQKGRYEAGSAGLGDQPRSLGFSCRECGKLHAG